MTNISTTAARRGASKPGDPGRQGFVARIILFIRQVLDEIRKVVRPTQSELVNYTGVVVVFICFIMAFVVGLDRLFERLVSFVLGT